MLTNVLATIILTLGTYGEDANPKRGRARPAKLVTVKTRWLNVTPIHAVRLTMSAARRRSISKTIGTKKGAHDRACRCLQT